MILTHFLMRIKRMPKALGRGEAGMLEGEAMKQFTDEPDPWMVWIDDPTHPDYHSPEARDLRAARERALAQVPWWMWRLFRAHTGPRSHDRLDGYEATL